MAAKKSTAKTKSAKPLAIALLIKDHETVSGYFKKYEKLGENAHDAKGALIAQICSALTVHAAIEEEIFYPEMREATGEAAEDNLDEAVVEHASIKTLIAELEHADPSDDLVDARVKVLTEYVRHHVEEEQTEIFPKAMKAKGLDLDEMGERMEMRKAELVDELANESEVATATNRGGKRTTQGRR